MRHRVGIHLESGRPAASPTSWTAASASTDADDGANRPAHPAIPDPPPRPEACVFSPDGRRIAYVRPVPTGGRVVQSGVRRCDAAASVKDSPSLTERPAWPGRQPSSSSGPPGPSPARSTWSATAGQQVLLDSGLFQGLKELRLRNWLRPEFAPREIASVVLSHAHIDHTGYLPLLVKRGFRGRVHCTAATADLIEILLPGLGQAPGGGRRPGQPRGLLEAPPGRARSTTCDDVKAALQAGRAAPVRQGVPGRRGHAGDVPPHRPHPRGRVDRPGDRQAGPGAASSSPATWAATATRSSTTPSRSRRPTWSWSRAPTATGCTRRTRSPTWSGSSTRRSTAAGRSSSRRSPSGGRRSCSGSSASWRSASRIPELPVYIDSPMATEVTELYCHHTGEHNLPLSPAHRRRAAAASARPGR